MRGKSTNGLMMHIRNDHNIDIKGSTDKKKLTEMGYYHGYKAYRFLKTQSHMFNVSEFSQITAIYNYDMSLKQMMYPYIMRLETLLKNVVLNEIVTDDTSFINIFNNRLTHFRQLSSGSRTYNSEMSKRLRLKSKLEKLVADNYARPYVSHYINSEKSLPIWAYFELMMMGDFGNFVSLLDTDTKLCIAHSLNTFDVITDTDGSMLEQHIFILKDLRNSIAHNNIIFDTRFRSSSIPNKVGDQLQQEFNINVPIKFNTITDYPILIVHYFHNFGQTKSETKRFVNSFLRCADKLKNELNDNNIAFQILGSDYKLKLETLLNNL
ncbi:Abi family protein [Leuconostoc mesenteroides]|uniref:Abi family protein n=1 Tax=Leuconostoc mesenteroides TaxID=1245 RepID=UPI000E0907A3|nr:Abi family protein [Leuconostoc mesenteroides]MDP0486294.1 Abi family protein [Leuconostoc mesenteroides]RDF91827.1 Abi family protein [Leuconostoc mesenteroides subsp. mesenteroides]